MSTAVATLSSIGLACLSYVFTTMHTLRSEQHKNLVDRVGQQLKTLYGPLLACLTASKSSYDAMVQQVCNQPGRRGMRTDADFKMAVRNNPRGPLSHRAANLVMERADLLEGTSIEPLLLQLVAHVSAYKVILKQWEQGAVNEFSQVPYPEDLQIWVSNEFGLLKRRQAMLLGLGGKRLLGNGGLMRLAAKL